MIHNQAILKFFPLILSNAPCEIPKIKIKIKHKITGSKFKKI